MVMSQVGNVSASGKASLFSPQVEWIQSAGAIYSADPETIYLREPLTMGAD